MNVARHARITPARVTKPPGSDTMNEIENIPIDIAETRIEGPCPGWAMPIKNSLFFLFRSSRWIHLNLIIIGS